MSENKSISQYFRDFYEILSQHGIDKVLDKLNELNLPSFSEHNDKIINHIIKICSNEYNVSQSDLKKKYVRGESAIARRLSIMLMLKHVPKISYKEIASKFDRTSKSFISIEVNHFNRLGDSLRYEKEEKEAFKRLDNKIFEFKEILLLTHNA